MPITDRLQMHPGFVKEVPSWLLPNRRAPSTRQTWRSILSGCFAIHKSGSRVLTGGYLDALIAIDIAVHAETRLLESTSIEALADGVFLRHLNALVETSFTDAVGHAHILAEAWRACVVTGVVSDCEFSHTLDEWAIAMRTRQTFGEWLAIWPDKTFPKLTELKSHCLERQIPLCQVIVNRKCNEIRSITAKEIWKEFEHGRGELIKQFRALGRDDWARYTQTMSSATFWRTKPLFAVQPGSSKSLLRLDIPRAQIVAKKKRARKCAVKFVEEFSTND